MVAGGIFGARGLERLHRVGLFDGDHLHRGYLDRALTKQQVGEVLGEGAVVQLGDDLDLFGALGDVKVVLAVVLSRQSHPDLTRPLLIRKRTMTIRAFNLRAGANRHYRRRIAEVAWACRSILVQRRWELSMQ